MPDLAVIATAFALTFLAELPDKSNREDVPGLGGRARAAAHELAYDLVSPVMN